MDDAFDCIGKKFVELRFSRFRIVMDFGFPAMLALIFLRMQDVLIRQMLLVCLIHELGHGLAMCLTGAGIQEIRLYAAGIQMRTDTCLLGTGQAVFISLSGPLVNLLNAGLLWKIQPVTAILHMSIGIFNLLPFPALDGGRILFLLIRKITGRRVTKSMEAKVHFVGIVLLLALMVYVTWNDISRLFTG